MQSIFVGRAQFNLIFPPDRNRADSRGEGQRSLNLGAKAVLKTPQSTRWRDCHVASPFAKRLDCGAFTAAFQLRRFLPAANLHPSLSALAWADGSGRWR
jgi:hypothetical protein